jgi:serine/threonine-protein kinase
MAEVYKAIDTRLSKRVVAIKVLSAGVADHPFADRMRTLFIQEAQALSRISDQNVVEVFDFGLAEDGSPYMVMEFLRGVDLGELLKIAKHLSIDEALDVILGVCAGVHACHLAGIIHRDLKPANVFLARTLKGQLPKVLDFSVAKIPIAQDAATAEQTRTDLIVGTPSYMSPEQALGRPATALSDQYAVGALLYRCLAGRPPRGVVPKPGEVLPDIPSALEDAILRAMDPAPENRFASVHELGQALLPFASEAARGQWEPYYHAPPKPFDPNTTGSITRDMVRPLAVPEPPSLASTVPARPHGLEIHEQTTLIEVTDSLIQSIRPLEEPVEHTSAAAADFSIDVTLTPSPRSESEAMGASMPTLAPTDLAGQTSREASVALSTAVRPNARSADHDRWKIVLGFGLATLAVVAVAGAGATRLGRPRDYSVLRPPLPGAAVSGPMVSEVKPEARAPLPPPMPAAATPSAGPSASTSPIVPAEPAKPRRGHHPRPPRLDPVKFADDGMPILD